MDDPNTLFILAKFGLIRIDSIGIFESHMWFLNEQEQTMKYASFHKSKADRAYKGGKIIEVRDASDIEIEAHQNLMVKHGKGVMKETSARKIIVFQLEPKWNALWPKAARSNPMAYKGTGFVDWNETDR